MPTATEPGVVVIGAGVVGLSVAIAAQARGLAVTVLAGPVLSSYEGRLFHEGIMLE